ncbi:hypothetical protein QJS66_18800 [Kocuria rhizophila]|nr:hypothetical protein QJS66_18800 [Kocuria rhizophila]
MTPPARYEASLEDPGRAGIGRPPRTPPPSPRSWTAATCRCAGPLDPVLARVLRGAPAGGALPTMRGTTTSRRSSSRTTWTGSPAARPSA